MPARPAVLVRHWPVAVLALVLVGASVAVRHAYFPYGFSGDADEGAHVWQALVLLQGHLTVPGSGFGGAFRPWLSGAADGRVFSEYWPGWASVLALSSWVTGSMAYAPLAFAVAWLVAVYALGWELFRDRRIATVAAALLGLSPLLLLHSVLYVPYVFSAALITGAIAVGLRGLRLQRRGLLAVTGLLAGLALTSRPFDVAVAAVPVAVYLLFARREAIRWSAAGWVLAGVAPFVVFLLVYNAVVTGGPLRTPLSASDPLNVFGFGERRIMPAEVPVDYSISVAYESLRANLHGMPSWLLGGPLTAVAAVAGLFGRAGRARRMLLLGLAASFPVAYFFWWGSALSAPGAVNGIGPHYYLPAFGAIALLAAAGLVGLADAARRRRVAVPAMALGLVPVLVIVVAAAAVLTGRSVESKIDNQHRINAMYRDAIALADAVPAARTPGALLVVSPRVSSNYVGQPYPVLRNDATGGQRRYAADLGTVGYQLGLQSPGRQLIRIRPGVGAATPLTTASGTRLCVDAAYDSPRRSGAAYGYLQLGPRTERGARQTLTAQRHTWRERWRLSARDLAAGPQYVAIGMADAAGRIEQRLSAGPAGSRIAAQWPGYAFRLADGIWQEQPDTPGVAVTVTAC